MSQIIPAILPYSPNDYYRCLNAIDHVAPCVHLDITDGRFVSGCTWSDVDTIQDATAIDIELHLMAKDALRGVKIWAEIPQVKRVNIHIESENVARAIKQLHNWKKEVRVAINPDTPITSIIPSLDHVNGVLFMTVYPGQQGNPFIESVVPKIKLFHDQYPNCPIAVDGHVDETTIPKLLAAGATDFCVGSAIFKNENPEAAYKHLIELTQKT